MRADFFTTLLATPPDWLSVDGPLSEVVLSSRIRLARNVAGVNFPGRADAAQRLRVRQMVVTAALGALGAQDMETLDLSETDETRRLVLAERQLISRQMCLAKPGAALCLNADNRLGILVNEEDHVRLQGFRPGLDFAHVWQALEVCDDRLCAELPVAFDRRLGFLTACPSNVGTGMRASVLIWLPALCMDGQMPKIVNAMQALGFALRGTFGEGTEAVGQVFQISNQSTLGETESGILFRLEKVVRQVVNCERVARLRLAGRGDQMLADFIGRAFGVLRFARRISTREALDALFAVRLGVSMGFFKSLPLAPVNALIMGVQRGHLAFGHGESGSSSRRRVARATAIRQTLADWFE